MGKRPRTDEEREEEGDVVVALNEWLANRVTRLVISSWANRTACRGV